MAVDLTAVEQEAYAAMLVWLADELAQVFAINELSDHPELKNLVVQHDCATWTEETFDLLLRCGILGACSPDDPQGDSPQAARFVVTRDEIGERAADRVEGRPDFEWVLTAFIERAVDFHGLCSYRTAFSVRDGFVEILNLLSKLGYISRSDDRFSWTSKIGPVMVATRCWTDAGQSLKALEEATLQRKIRELPAHVRHEVAYLVAQKKAINAAMVIAERPDWDIGDALDALELLHPGCRSR